MYFETYEQAKEAAIKQSIGKLVDCKLYVKHGNALKFDPIFQEYVAQYTIGFTPDNPKDAYIYNGELKND